MRGLLRLCAALLAAFLVAGLAAGVQQEPVKIGLLLPPAGVAEGEAVRRGAELAVAEANRAGGYRGRPFVLVVRREEGAWGAGASRIADLAARERVWALVGSVDGRSAHLARRKGETAGQGEGEGDAEFGHGM